MQVLDPQLSHAPGSVSENKRVDMLDSWKTRLQSVWNEQPLKFVHIDHFDEKAGFKLTTSYEEKYRDSEHGPTVGQNLGLALPSSSMTKRSSVVHKHGKL